MTGPLPTHAQTIDRAADGLVRDLDPMMILQVSTQEWGGPDGGVIAEPPWVVVDHGGDPFIDGAAGRPWTAKARGVEEARPQVQLGSLLESAQPVVDGLPADLEQFRDLSDVGPLGDPEQRLGSTSLLGPGGMGNEFFQFAALPVSEREHGHQFTPEGVWWIDSHTTRLVKGLLSA
jgi:hypothetical protein